MALKSQFSCHIVPIAIGTKGGLILNSPGKEFGDAGFYFLLNDSKGNYWTQFISSFRDRLTVSSEKAHILAKQVLTLWHQRVAKFNYKIVKK